MPTAFVNCIPQVSQLSRLRFYIPHLREYNNYIVPTKVVGYPYPGYDPQEDKDG